MSKSTTQYSSVLDELAAAASEKTRARYEEQKANGVVNPIVLAELLGVRPQMIYNYIRKGKIAETDEGIGQNNTQKKTIDLNVAEGFVHQQVEKRKAKAAKIEAELLGLDESVEAAEEMSV